MTIDGSPRYAMVSAFISKYYDGTYRGCGSSLDDSLHTVTSKDHNAIVTAHIIQLNYNMIGTDMREPLNTIVAGPGHIGEVRAFLIKYYGQGTGQDIKDPLDTVVSKDRFGLVTIQGQDYQIVDIGLRMLEPKELYAAQGFPKDYIIDHDLEGHTIDKSEQVKRCGNAVPPPFAKALVRANLPEYAGERKPNMRIDYSKPQLQFA
jgi:DNA (cytosine-5)-methyltransferase 1